MRRSSKNKNKKKPTNTASAASSNAPPAAIASTSANSGEGWREEARDGLILGLNFVRDLSESTDLLAPLKGASALVIRGLETARTVQNNKAAWRELIEELEEQKQGLQKYVQKIDDKQAMEETMRPALTAYLRSLSKIVDRAQKAKAYSELGVVRRFGRTQIDVDQVQELTRGTDRAYKRFMEAISTLMVHQITAVAQDIKEMRVEIREQFAELQQPNTQLSKLETASELSEKFFKLVYGVDLEVCQKGTRVAILERIRTWAKDTATSKRIFWLNDTAGAGKTTVASTMAREWMREGQLAGRFFFTPNSKLASGISEFCRVVARDVAVLIPSLAPVINKAISETPSWQFPFEEALHRLIISPLKAHKETVMFVIDALDNCDAADRKTLLDVVIPTSANVKILITSRPIPDIKGTLDTCEEVEGLDVHLHDPKDVQLQADIASYVNKNLRNLTPKQREEVISHSHGLFIWASTACRYLKNSRRPTEAIQKLLDSSAGDDLDTLYLRILNQALVDREALHHLVGVFQVIIAVFEPVSIITVRTFLPSNDQVEVIVKDLGSVLRADGVMEPIQVIHPTFRSFLCHKERAKDFFVDLDSAHELLALRSIEMLQSVLIYDFLGLVKPGSFILSNTRMFSVESKLKTKLTAEIAYASAHWVYHVMKSLHCTTVLQATQAFISKNLLNWVELMAWRSQTTRCVSELSDLNASVRDRRDKTEASYQNDNTFFQAYEFVQQNQDLIRAAPLHIYHSALVFAPKNNPLFDGYREQHEGLATYVMDRSPRQVDATLLVGHTRMVTSIVFSPDDTRLATLSCDRTVRLWNTTSGADIAGPMKNDDDNPNCMVFSSNGSMLVVGYSRGGLALWDGRSGHLKSRARKPYEDLVTLISFSCSDDMVVSASKYEMVIQLWDASSESLVHIGELNHDDKVSCFSVSFDGKMIASSSGAGIVTLWSVDKRERLHQLQAPENSPIQSIVFTPEDVVITISKEGTIRSWEGQSGKFRQLVVAGHAKSVEPEDGPPPFILCSPNGDYLVSVTDRVTLWKKFGGRYKEINLSDAHIGSRIVSFSRDGKGLASVLDTGQMRIWNTETGRVLQNVEFERPRSLTSCAISQTLDRLVVTSENDIVRLYTTNAQILLDNNPDETTSLGALEAIELSSNQEFVVTASEDYSLQLWSASTGKSIGPKIIGHTEYNTALAFSPDSHLLTSGSYDGQVKLWTVPAGEERLLMDSSPASEHVLAAMFSQNSELLAAGWARPGLVRVWNVMSGSKTEPLFRSVCRKELAALAFSCNGELVVGAQARYIEIWHVSDGSIFCCIKHQYSQPELVTISPEKDRVAMLASGIITIWDIQGETQLISDFHTDRWPDSYLSMAPNGYLVFGSSVWDTRSEKPELTNEITLPSNLRYSKSNPRTLLSYRKGWIYSAAREGRKLLAIPRHLGIGPETNWSAQGNVIVFASWPGKPLIVDCSPMLEL